MESFILFLLSCLARKSADMQIDDVTSGSMTVETYTSFCLFVVVVFLSEELPDTWYCQKCREERNASKCLSLCRLPDTLIIHLKRYVTLRFV